MPVWLAAIIGGWLKDWAISAISWLVSFFQKIARYKKIETDNNNQAKTVQSVADQIKQLLKDGKPIPPELTERLLEENSKLNNPNNIP